MEGNRIFHVHSFRCGHASKEKDEAYVKKAIELGAAAIYFSDHGPFPEENFRFKMTFSELPDYIGTLQKLKEKYDGQIDIKIGVEIEYVPKYNSFYRDLKEVYKLDFLLLGQHFSLLPDGRYTFEVAQKATEAKELADGILNGIKTGYFDMVAHPDQIFRRKKEWTDEEDAIANEIKGCAVQYGVSLEKNIRNMIGKVKKRSYRPEFWEDVPDGLNIIYGLDAHSTMELEEGFNQQQLLEENDESEKMLAIGKAIIEKHIEAFKKLAE